ncbi:MAG: hypothetical protein OXP12_03910 [Thaumarchaeota archaeon]|nr:hypothetical protein [Nitrososphaerota archaeon]
MGRGPGAPREPECARREKPGVGGFGNDGGGGSSSRGGGGSSRGGGGSSRGGGGYDGGKSERRAAGRGPDDARAAGPAAGAERQAHESSGCGHHIMLACAARREMRGRGAAPSPPEPMYSYNGGRGSSRPGVRRRDDDNRGEAAGNAS